VTLYGAERWTVEEIIEPDTDDDPQVVGLRKRRQDVKLLAHASLNGILPFRGAKTLGGDTRRVQAATNQSKGIPHPTIRGWDGLGRRSRPPRDRRLRTSRLRSTGRVR